MGIIKKYEEALFYQDFLLINETVIAAFAQTFAFNYNEFIDMTKSQQPLLTNLSKILSMKDVLADAKNTFVNEEEEHHKPLNVIFFYVKNQYKNIYY